MDVRVCSAHARADEAASRTAKACGPDLPTLGSSLKAKPVSLAVTVATKPGTPGRARNKP
jgi:hypothetical protein